MKVKRRELFHALTRAVLTVVLFLICLDGVFRQSIDRTELTGSARADIYSQNGVLSRTQLKPKDWVIGPGETLVISAPMPAAPCYGRSCSLALHADSATVQIVCSGRLLYSAGMDAASAHQTIGTLFVHCEIPEDAWGSSVEISIRSYGLNRVSFHTRLCIMPTDEVNLYPLVTHPVILLLFLVTAVVAAFVLIYQSLTALHRRDKELRKSIALSAFVLLLSLWYLGYHQVFYLFHLAPALCSNIEYVVLYLAWLPFMTYLLLTVRRSWFRSFCQSMMMVLTVDMLVGFAMSFSSIKLDLADMLHLYRILMAVTLAVAFVRAVSYRKKVQMEERLKILGIGVLAGFGFAEILMFRLRAVIDLPDWMAAAARFDFAGVGLLFYFLAIGVSALLQRQEDLKMRIRQTELLRLAYLDPLTGIPNRASVTEKMTVAAGEGTVVFMDIDYLKRANDRYGHEMGDRLIRAVAESIREAFEENGGPADCYGRWGGDEFIALFLEEEHARRFVGGLKTRIHSVNESGAFPFPVNVSVGMEEGGAGGADPEDRIAAADRVMYHEKQRHHQ